MSVRRRLARIGAVLIFLVVGLCTYPGADLVSLVARLTPPPATAPVPPGLLPWLHIAHPADGMPVIADDEGRFVLLHGAIPAGLIDFSTITNPLRTDTPPFYPIDPAAYDGGRCPANSGLVKAPPLCEQDVAEMAALGFNSIRLPLSWSLLEPERGKFNETYLDRIAQVVAWAREAGLYVILDMHQNMYSRYIGRSDPVVFPGGKPVDPWYNSGAPAWATLTDGFPSEVFLNQGVLNPAVLEADSNFWYNRDGIQAEYIATLAFVAQRFKDDSTVAGYSLYNEPWPGWNLSPGFEDLLLFPFYRRIIDALTGIHDGLPCPTHVFMPAFCGYLDLGVHDLHHLFFLDAGLLREVTDFPTHLGLPVSSYENLVLSIHTYTHGFTFDALAGQKPDKATYPWGGYDQTYSLAEREAKAINAALFDAEFGNDPSWDSVILSNELREQEQHLVGFAFWTWKENCGGAGSWGIYDGISCGGPADIASKPANGCLRNDRERMLARVYPRISSDLNLTYRYDDGTGAFALQGRGHAGDAPTVVYIPREVTGAVTATGVASDPSITVDAAGGRVVAVTPAGGPFSITVAPAPLKLTAC